MPDMSWQGAPGVGGNDLLRAAVHSRPQGERQAARLAVASMALADDVPEMFLRDVLGALGLLDDKEGEDGRG